MQRLTLAFACSLGLVGTCFAQGPTPGPVVDDDSVEGSTANDCDTSVEPKAPTKGLRFLYTQHADAMGPVTDLLLWSPVDMVFEHSSVTGAYTLPKNTVHTLSLSGHTSRTDVEGRIVGVVPKTVFHTTGTYSSLPIPPRVTVIDPSASELVVRVEFHGRAASFRLSNLDPGDIGLGTLPVKLGPQDTIGSNVLTFLYGANGDQLEIDIENPNVDFRLAHSSLVGFKKLVPKSVGGHTLVLKGLDVDPRGALLDEYGTEVLAFDLHTAGVYDSSSNTPTAHLESINGSKTGAKLNHALVVRWRGLTVIFEVGGV